MRPQAIVNFERIMFVSLALGVIQAVIGRNPAIQKLSPGFVLTVQFIAFAMILGLVLLTAYRHSKIAKWILVVSFVLGLPVFFKSILQGAFVEATWVIVIQMFAQLIANCLLFTDPAREWLNESN